MEASDASVSESCRKEAAGLLQSECLLEAAACYTKSLAFAPTAASKGACYAGRSAVLLASGHLRHSVRDAERALAAGYPELLRFKLHLRMAVCFRALGHGPRAHDAFQRALALIEASSVLGPDKKKSMSEQATSEFEAPLKSGEALFVNYERPPSLAYGPAPDNECMSAAVRVHDDQHFGRHLVAARDINTGDVLVVEKPAFSFLLETENSVKGNKEAIWTHCSQCYKMSLSLEPCAECKWALYCSTECKDEAWNSYHKAECRIRRKYEMLKGASDPYSTSSWVRILIKFLSTISPGDEKIAEILKLLPDEFSDDKLERLQKLSTKLANICCEGSGEKEKQAIAELCSKVLLVFQRNSYTIDETHFVPSIDAFRSREVIGRGFFLTVALLNHSCDANTTRVFHLNTQVVRAARPIKKGEQIFAGYGPDYGGMERDQRQRVLRGKFFFRCLCEACDDSWPLATTTLGVVPEFLKQQPHLQLLKEVVQLVIAPKTFQGRFYSTVMNENVLEKCKALQNLYLEHGIPRADWIYYFTEKFIINHYDLSAKKLANESGDGEPYISAYNEHNIFQILS